jgi:NAD(P)-dependent dehydrogenase (short-subunit alcohol dehydrogenase family)
METNLKGARIVVTGASRGIGAATAVALAAAGAHVVVNYLTNREAAARVEAQIRAIGQGAVTTYQADVRDPSEAERLIAICVERFGGLDGLVNNAHVASVSTPFERLSWDDMQGQIDGCLKSVFVCTQAALPHLLRSRSASVLNMSTVMLNDPQSRLAARMSAKGAVEGLTRSLAWEYGRQGVRFNALSVGWTRTEQLGSVSDNVIRHAAAMTSLGRLAEPAEIAATAVFLMSSAASYITGSVFPVGGGVSPDPR